MRGAWITVCAVFLFLWITVGWLLFPFNLLMALASIGAMFLPVGKDKTVRITYINNRPQFPSSVYDERFSIEERNAFFYGDERENNGN